MKSFHDELRGHESEYIVMVVTVREVATFPNLEAAREYFPTLDPYRNTHDFTWAMRDMINGKPIMRFEDWATDERMSV